MRINPKGPPGPHGDEVFRHRRGREDPVAAARSPALVRARRRARRAAGRAAARRAHPRTHTALAALHGREASALASAVDETVIAHVGGEVDALGDDVTLVVVSRDA